MNKDDLIKKLENLDLPEIELPSHQRRLKMALLNSGYFKKQTTMSLLKKFAPIGAVAVIALLAVVGVNYFKNPSLVEESDTGLLQEPLDNSSPLTRILDGISPRQAWAKELVGLAQEQLTNLKAVAAMPNPSTGFVEWKTPDADGNIRDEKGNIIYTTTPEGELVPMPYEVPVVSETITKDFALLLEEAYQAKDLAYIGDKVLSDGKKVKMLRFTKEGSTVILGIGENNLPVVKIVSDGETGGGIILEEGPSSGKSVEEMMNFWTENLEQPKDFEAIQK